MRQRASSRFKPRASHLAWYTPEISDPPGQGLFSSTVILFDALGIQKCVTYSLFKHFC